MEQYNLLSLNYRKRVNDLGFEESLKKLEEMSELIKKEDTTLEEAIKYYEEGIKCYEQCNSILKEVSQKIDTIRKEEA